jgi:hypothetical protein
MLADSCQIAQCLISIGQVNDWIHDFGLLKAAEEQDRVTGLVLDEKYGS